MDILIEAGEVFQEKIFFSVAHLLNLEVDILFFDTTSTYFERRVEPALLLPFSKNIPGNIATVVAYPLQI